MLHTNPKISSLQFVKELPREVYSSIFKQMVLDEKEAIKDNDHMIKSIYLDKNLTINSVINYWKRSTISEFIEFWDDRYPEILPFI